MMSPGGVSERPWARPPSASWRPSRFALCLGAIVLIALVIRVAFAMLVASDLPFGVDADYYRLTAEGLRSGDGFALRPAYAMWPTTNDPTVVVPAGVHPPLPSLVLAAGGLVGLTSWDEQRVLLAVFSTIGVALMGLLGRRVGGAAVGLVAAAIVAGHPMWFQYPGFLSSEATFTVTGPAVILAGMVAVQRRDLRSMAVMGIAIGFAALTRSEAVLFVPFLALPVCVLARRRVRVRAVAVTLAATGIVLAPWLLWMHATYDTVSLSLNGGVTIAIANCPETYAGPRMGSVGCGFGWLAAAQVGVPPGLDREQKVVFSDRAARNLGVGFARDNVGRLPAVAAARVGRTLGVFRVSDSVQFDSGIGAAPSYQRVAFATHWGLLLLTGAGVATLVRRRSRRVLLVLASGPAVALVTTIAIYGATRIRFSAEPAIAVCAALALVTMVSSVRDARERMGTPPPTVPSGR